MMWKESYESVPLIDQQPQELFHRVSVFIKLLGKRRLNEKPKVKETMDFMQNT